MDPQVEQPSFLQKYKFTLISLFVIILAAIPLLLLSNTASKKALAPSMPITISTPTPTAAPLTTQNVEPTLTQEDNTINQTLNQMDSDVESTNKIDASQDSTGGL